MFMQGPDSPSKKAKRFSASKDRASGKYDPESLIPSNYDEMLIKKKEEEDRMGGTN